MSEYLNDFVQESEDHITALNNALLALERDPDDDEAMETIFRIAHTLKGNCGAMGIEPASDLAHAIEDLLDAVRTGSLEVSSDLMDVVFDAVDELETMIDEVAEHGAVETDPSPTIRALREPLEAPTPPSIESPSADEVEDVLAGVDRPSNDDHDAYLARLAITPHPEINNGELVVEALIDAFELLGTEPPRGTIDADAYGGSFDAVFGSAVGEAAIESGLEPVEEVADFELVDVTDRLAETGSDADDAEDAGDELSAAQAQELEVDELLDEFEEYDDLDERVEELEDDDLDAFDEMGDAGSFDDLFADADADLEPPSADPATESADAGSAADAATGSDDDPVAGGTAGSSTDDVEDASAVFDELKNEVEMVGFDELQDELAELEFDEFDTDDEVDIDDLLEDDAGDEAFFDDDATASEGDEPSASGVGDESGVADDEPATDAGSTEPGAEPIDEGLETVDAETGSDEGLEPVETGRTADDADAQPVEPVGPESTADDDHAGTESAAAGTAADAATAGVDDAADEFGETESLGDGPDETEPSAGADDGFGTDDGTTVEFDDGADGSLETESLDFDEPFDDATDAPFEDGDDDPFADVSADSLGIEGTDDSFEETFGDPFADDSSEPGFGSAGSAADGSSETGASDGADADPVRTVDEPSLPIPDLTVPASTDRSRDADASETTQSVRVDVEQIDSLLTLVEGLVTSRVRLRHAIEEGEDLDAIAAELDDLEDLTSELQETVMDVRLVPLRTVTGRLPRVVRDIAREQDKEVEFEMRGADVELDRSILDRIGDPLVHLVRNAVDHGIEPPDEREAADKSREGTVTVTAERSRDRVTIAVADDGGGLEPDRLRAAAVDADVLTEVEAADLDDDEAADLVFHPGLSTNEEVTDVSGRGVGMDVVSRTIEDLGGTVSVDSDPGEGTTVTMTLPVSVAIDDVLFVESGGEEFGIPTEAVHDIEAAAAVETTDGKLVHPDEDATSPLVHLEDALETPATDDGDDGMVVRIRDEVRSVALHCDRVHGQQEVVVTPFEGFMSGVPGLSGATVRGRGKVVNILDVTTL